MANFAHRGEKKALNSCNFLNMASNSMYDHTNGNLKSFTKICLNGFLLNELVAKTESLSYQMFVFFFQKLVTEKSSLFETDPLKKNRLTKFL